MVLKNPKPIHPGRVLETVYMSELNLSQSELARRIGCSPRKINEIVNGKRGISPEFAIELEKTIHTSAEMWVRMQAEYDLQAARVKVA
jgi:addiction module HigA family antidote